MDILKDVSNWLGVSTDTITKAGSAAYNAYQTAKQEASSISSADMTRGTLGTSYGQVYNPGRVNATADSVSPAQLEDAWKARLRAFAGAEGKAEKSRVGRDARNKYFG